MSSSIFFLLISPCFLIVVGQYFGPDADYLDEGVTMPSGERIIGRSTIFYGQIARQYLGIPYAKPPIGSLRFKKPEPVEPRTNGTFMADTMPPACVQHSRIDLPWYDNGEDKSEDCLYLNIWTGRFPPKELQVPVLFWIYGGDYTVGSNRLDSSDGTDLSVIGTSVVVAPNYRVGAMGFLSSGTKDAPGNVGIHDLILALKWTRDNIAPFGGDPDRITIFGQGSGSMTVSLFLLSPLTKGLFNSAIMQSGSFLVDSRIDPNEYNLQLGQKLAEAVGCAENTTLKEDPEQVTDCLREADADRLAQVLSSFDTFSTKSFLPQYGDDFLPENPVGYLKNGNFSPVPLLIGNNKDEGSYLLTTRNQGVFGLAGEKDPLISKSYGADILRRTFAHLPNPESVVRQYLEDVEEDDYKQVRHQVYTALGDYTTVCPSLYFAEKYSAANKTVEYYVFAQRPTDSPWAEWMGTTHYDEVRFIFGRYLEGYDYESFNRDFNGEIGMSYFMMQTWGDFAKEGKALPKWKNFTNTHHQYMLLKAFTPLKLRGPGPHLDNCNFFREHFDM